MVRFDYYEVIYHLNILSMNNAIFKHKKYHYKKLYQPHPNRTNKQKKILKIFLIKEG